MLKTRIITALVLLSVMLPVLFGGSFLAFAMLLTLFFGAAIWESFRLFGSTQKQALLVAVCWSVAFVYSFLVQGNTNAKFWFGLSMAIWLIRFVPSLKTGLPPIIGLPNTLLSVAYAVAIVSCFAAILVLFHHSPVYLLSVMALVWIADIGAYAAGKTFGKRKLAPSISPGKSWEGAIGGGVAVLVLTSISVLCAHLSPIVADTFAVHVQAKLGWPALLAILVVMVGASIVGDLFESQLKRRSGVKDSSKLLPGHGGVLDRIDALIPVLPLAGLIDAWF